MVSEHIELCTCGSWENVAIAGIRVTEPRHGGGLPHRHHRDSGRVSGQPPPNSPDTISINSWASIFTAVMKAADMLPVAAGAYIHGSGSDCWVDELVGVDPVPRH